MKEAAALDRLEAAGLIRVASVYPELEYLFRHWLVQEATYDSLLKRDRRRLHLVVGEALEELYPERRGDLAAELALHLEEAGEAARAIPYLIEAGRHAITGRASQEAHGFFERAERLIAGSGDDPETRRRRVEIALGRVESGWTFKPPEEVLATLRRGLPLATSLADDRLLVEVYSWIAMIRQFQGEQYGASPELSEAIDRATEIAERLGEPGLRARPLTQLGMALAYGGEYRKGADLLREVVPILEEQGRVIDACLALGSIAIAYTNLGEFKLAEEASERALHLAEGGDPIAKLDSANVRALLELTRGNLDRALELAHWCREKSDELGVVACSIASHLTLGTIQMMRGRPELAINYLERSGELSLVSLKFWQPMTKSVLSTARAMTGSLDAARAGWEEAVQHAIEIGDRWVEANARVMRAGFLAHVPDPDWPAVFADFDRAVEVFESLEARPALARALREYSIALRAAGDASEATERRARALDLFAELGLKDEADALSSQA